MPTFFKLHEGVHVADRRGCKALNKILQVLNIEGASYTVSYVRGNFGNVDRCFLQTKRNISDVERRRRTWAYPKFHA